MVVSFKEAQQSEEACTKSSALAKKLHLIAVSPSAAAGADGTDRHSQKRSFKGLFHRHHLPHDQAPSEAQAVGQSGEEDKRSAPHHNATPTHPPRASRTRHQLFLPKKLHRTMKRSLHGVVGSAGKKHATRHRSPQLQGESLRELESLREVIDAAVPPQCNYQRELTFRVSGAQGDVPSESLRRCWQLLDTASRSSSPHSRSSSVTASSEALSEADSPTPEYDNLLEPERHAHNQSYSSVSVAESLSNHLELTGVFCAEAGVSPFSGPGKSFTTSADFSEETHLDLSDPYIHLLHQCQRIEEYRVALGALTGRLRALYQREQCSRMTRKRYTSVVSGGLKDLFLPHPCSPLVCSLFEERQDGVTLGSDQGVSCSVSLDSESLANSTWRSGGSVELVEASAKATATFWLLRMLLARTFEDVFAEAVQAFDQLALFRPTCAVQHTDCTPQQRAAREAFLASPSVVATQQAHVQQIAASLRARWQEHHSLQEEIKQFELLERRNPTEVLARAHVNADEFIAVASPHTAPTDECELLTVQNISPAEALDADHGGTSLTAAAVAGEDAPACGDESRVKVIISSSELLASPSKTQPARRRVTFALEPTELGAPGLSGEEAPSRLMAAQRADSIERLGVALSYLDNVTSTHQLGLDRILRERNSDELRAAVPLKSSPCAAPEAAAQTPQVDLRTPRSEKKHKCRDPKLVCAGQCAVM